MPRKKIKSKEEKTAENYFPVDKSNLDYATEKSFDASLISDERKELLKKSVEIPVKYFEKEILKKEITKRAIEKEYKKPDRSILETVEKIGKLKKLRKKSKKRVSKKKTISKKKISKKEFKPLEINLKKNGYELIITEKPQAALKISSALGKSVKRDNQKVPYYEIERDGKKLVVACAVGHLFTLSQNVSGSSVPIFDISWVPNYLVRKKDFTKRYYDTLLKLAKNAGTITVATDYDVEGEVIGLNIVRFLCGQKDANRMKFSTLTSDELNHAYDFKSSQIDWGQAIAGETRHYLDWFYGINLSRALMNSIKSTGKFRIMSIGRVQGPTLNLIVQKEREIQMFKPEPYWQIFIKIIDKDKNELELKYYKDIFEKKELDKFKDIKNKKVQVETKKSQEIIPPNFPFNLTTLQTESYKFHGITPSRTLQIAQSLYLGGLISYPRTSSQKLPDSIDYKNILKKLSKKYKVEHLIKKDKPIEGKKSDPAHPSIYPTAQNDIILSGEDEKIYNLIVKRFLSLFCENALVDNKKIIAILENKDKDLKFSVRGSSISKKAWMEIYPSKLKELEIKDMDGEAEIIDSKIEEKETKPPRRYSPASIVSELEKRNLGTKATRANILETLYSRGYIKEKSIEATSLGISLIETLENYSPVIINESLTRKFEEEMDLIRESKNNFEEKEDKVIEKAKSSIIEISKHFDKNIKKIGENLLNANIKLREEQKKENTLTQCPLCKNGNLAITYSKKTKRHFVACNAYPNCKNTFSLPPNGTIKKTKQICEECGFPKLMLLKAGRRPWIFCFNKECPINKERLEEYYEKKRQKEAEK